MSLFNTLIPSSPRPSSLRDEQRSADLVHTVKPAYEIKETPEAFGVTVHLPGVAKDGLEVTAESGQLRILGRRAWKQPEGWTALHRESAAEPFEIIFEHEHAVETDKVAAELRDGVLRLSLPKPEAIKPRRIAVN
ncbi:MAG: Hsp20/alpha crystallin family protein [Opitutaceae bacterium]|nr:Hsp20/alpha crystallin family protein [Opitutaceae bacterium]